MTDFGGRYRLDRRLGTGGMGEVWLAYDLELGDRPVAIKMMRSAMLSTPADLARFQREMRLASRMQHSNIMTVFTTGSDQGVPFMVMEYLQGSDLGKLPAGWSHDEVARIGAETCCALAYAHSLEPGVVHRDIKPGNLFVCETGTVKVTDFGLAKAVTEPTLSTAGTVLGTLPYISPEQWLGAPVTFSDDIWGVGCVLYALLSGRLPRLYESPIAYVSAAARREFVAPLPDTVPAGLANAVLAMLHIDPLSRPTASQAVELLSVRRAHRAQVPVPLTNAQLFPTRAEMPPAHREMALTGTRKSQPPPERPLSPTGPVTPQETGIPAQKGHDASGAPMPTRMPPRAEGDNQPKGKRKLLVSAIAGLLIAGAVIYAAVSALARPPASQGSSTAKDPVPPPASSVDISGMKHVRFVIRGVTVAHRPGEPTRGGALGRFQSIGSPASSRRRPSLSHRLNRRRQCHGSSMEASHVSRARRSRVWPRPRDGSRAGQRTREKHSRIKPSAIAGSRPTSITRLPDERRPLAVWIHGGALIMGDRRGIDRTLLGELIKAGYIVVSIDYRLAPETKLRGDP